MLIVSLAQVPASAECQLVRVAEWPVRLEERGDRLIVDGSVNGKPVGLLLDTGAMTTILRRSSASRLGIPTYRQPGVRMSGFGGETQVERARIDEIRIGDSARRNWAVLVAGEQGGDDAWDLLVGEDFLVGFDVEFDMAGRAVRFFQPKGCERTAIAYWARNASRVPIEPIDASRPRIVLDVELNGRPARAMLDSGAAVTSVDRQLARDVGVTPDANEAGRMRGIGAKTLQAWRGRFATVVVGDERVRDATLAVVDIAATGTLASKTLVPMHMDASFPPVILGADFLRSHRVLVSHSQRVLYFTYTGGTAFGTTSRETAPVRPPIPAPAAARAPEPVAPPAAPSVGPDQPPAAPSTR